MKSLLKRRFNAGWAPLALAALLALPVSATAQTEAELLEQVRTGQVGNRADEAKKLQAFAAASNSQQSQRLAELRAKRDALQQISQNLENQSLDLDREYKARIGQLREEMGPNSAMFGTLQNLSADLVGQLRNSPTSLDYPGRDQWLNAFGEKMSKTSEIFSIEELEKLWFLLQQEITASGKVVKLNTEVLGEDGTRATRPVVRIGKFGIISNDPEPAYLFWQAENQRASLLKRQPEGGHLAAADRYIQSGQGAVGIDPTAGSLLIRLVDAPSFMDRVDAGGFIGYLILALGALGVLIAVFKLISISAVAGKVAMQKRNLDQPSNGNPLGRMLKIYEDNKSADTETLEMRLGEAILEERPKIDRWISTIKVIAAVAPLMGLMGTVIGMIATFQAITLFGTGDPKAMAGGISQALVTTVEGLSVAIPMLLLHAFVSARAGSLMNSLKHQTAGLIAERMEARGAA